MNVSIESLLEDAKCLVGRLKDHDAAAASLSQKTGNLIKDIETRNTYQENLKDFNQVAGHQLRPKLVLGIQHENNTIRALQHENEELKQSLSEHQNALELIMSKYRHQMIQFIDNKKYSQVLPPADNSSTDEQSSENTQILMDKIHEMAAIMQTAANLDDETEQIRQQHVSRLEAENEGLRNLLLIANDQCGSYLTSDNKYICKEELLQNSAVEISDENKSDDIAS